MAEMLATEYNSRIYIELILQTIYIHIHVVTTQIHTSVLYIYPFLLDYRMCIICLFDMYTMIMCI